MGTGRFRKQMQKTPFYSSTKILPLKSLSLSLVQKKHLKALKSELSSDVLNDIVAVIPFWIASSLRQLYFI